MEIYVVVNKGKGVRAFHNWVDALELVSEHNNKVGRCAQFEFADKEMFDALMDERLQNVWTDTGFYEKWREEKLKELGITEKDLLEYTDTIFIHTVEVE